ncbi:MAG: hypothetical protein ACR2J8_10120, partial [Thermomicrobiales bacterium]
EQTQDAVTAESVAVQPEADAPPADPVADPGEARKHDGSADLAGRGDDVAVDPVPTQDDAVVEMPAADPVVEPAVDEIPRTEATVDPVAGQEPAPQQMPTAEATVDPVVDATQVVEATETPEPVVVVTDEPAAEATETPMPEATVETGTATPEPVVVATDEPAAVETAVAEATETPVAEATAAPETATPEPVVVATDEPRQTPEATESARPERTPKPEQTETSAGTPAPVGTEAAAETPAPVAPEAPVETPPPTDPATATPEPEPEPAMMIDPVADDSQGAGPAVEDAPLFELGSIVTLPDGAEFYDAANWTFIGNLPEGEVIKLVAGPVQDVLGDWWYQVIADDGEGMVRADAMAPIGGQDAAAVATPFVEPVADADSSLTPVTNEPVAPEADVQPTATASAEQVRVEALASGDAVDAVTAGESAGYRFRLTNLTGGALTVMPRVTNSQPGWGAVVTDTRTGKHVEQPVSLEAGTAVVISVQITIPANAIAGVVNTTTVTADIAP